MSVAVWPLMLAVLAVGLLPGPAVFAIVSLTLTRGLAPAFLFILGIITGDAVFAWVVMAGLAGLATTWPFVFMALKGIGGAYLIFLGVQSWRKTSGPTMRAQRSEKGLALMGSGFVLTASNPKDLLFFGGFLPLFVDLSRADGGDIALAVGIIVGVFFLTASFYALCAHAARRFFANPTALLWLQRGAGLVLVGLGLTVWASILP